MSHEVRRVEPFWKIAIILLKLLRTKASNERRFGRTRCNCAFDMSDSRQNADCKLELLQKGCPKLPLECGLVTYYPTQEAS